MGIVLNPILCVFTQQLQSGLYWSVQMSLLGERLLAEQGEPEGWFWQCFWESMLATVGKERGSWSAGKA